MSDRSTKSGMLSSRKLELLAALLEEQGLETEQPRAIPLREQRDEFPLSFAQQRIWVLDQIEPGCHYNDPFPLKLEGRLHPSVLERCLNEIVRRHEALRASFDVSDSHPVQRITSALHLSVPVVDLRQLPPDEREAEALRLTVHESRRRFDLRTGPLLRAKLIRLGDEQHILALTFHHIALDGWSRGVFLRELTALYQAYLDDRSSPLQELPIQYGDFAAWQRDWMQGEVLEKQLGYWKQQLNGAPAVTEIPPDRPRPLIQKYHGARCWFSVGKPLLKSINELSAQEGCTLFMVLIGAFQALIARYIDREDIIVGSPIANRNRAEIEGLIGYFLNILVVRTDLSGDPTFREVLKRVKEVTLGAYANQDLPFERLVQELHPPRDFSRSPLFQLAFILQNPPNRDKGGTHLSITPFDIDNGTTKYDLTISIGETPDGLSGGAEFDTALFEPSTIRRLVGHYVRLLESAVAEPNRRLSELALLTEEERSQLLVKWNRTEQPYPREKTVHGLFEEQARRTPKAVAVEYEGRRLTYAELNERSDRVAAVLRSQSIRPQEPVGISAERSTDLLVAVLGTLKAGGAYVPLDPAFPRERLAMMVDDSQMPVILAQRKLLATLPESDAQTVCLDGLPPAPSPVPEATTASPAGGSEDLAYVLFTSGSTGRPKGVQIPHRALVNFLCSMRREPGLRADDVLLAITTLSFDIAGLELLLPLITGAKVVIAPREVAVDGPRLAKLIRDSGATVMQATPATWRMLIESGWTGDSRLKILCGGEAIDPELADQLLNRCGELWNMYGPTETTIWSTAVRLARGEAVTIGRPIANTQVYILDARLEPVPVGVVGELFIGGEGVARGYLNRPDLTRERFVPNPFDSKGSGRLYRTGDLARFLADGRIEFLGRADQQVKIRGFRIELREIETALARCEGVAQSVVVAWEVETGEKRLVAYIAPQANGAVPGTAVDATGLSVSALRTALRRVLPEYMMPSAFIFLEDLPLTPNGKVDRKALPPPDSLASAVSEIYEAPQGATEEKLARMMGTLLKVQRVGRKDNFFDLGGYSILGVMLFNEIDREFGKRLPLATLFQAPTVEQIAAMLETEPEATHDWPSLVPIQPHGTKPRFFCVHGAGGNVLLYRELARYFEPEYPFYGLQAQGLDGKTRCLTSIEAMADRYLDEIRAVQPEGPYHLGGYCLGGTVAYEVAQRLRDEGQDVALLVLLDTYNFSRMEPPQLLGLVRQKLRFHSGNLMHMGLAHWPRYLLNKLRIARDGEWESLLKKAIGGMFHQNGPVKGQQFAEASVQEANDWAASAYRPKPYSGRLTVFKPRVNYDFLPDPQMGWGDLVRGSLEIVELNMNPHAMLVEPYVRELAYELRQRLDALESQK